MWDKIKSFLGFEQVEESIQEGLVDPDSLTRAQLIELAKVHPYYANALGERLAKESKS